MYVLSETFFAIHESSRRYSGKIEYFEQSFTIYLQKKIPRLIWALSIFRQECFLIMQFMNNCWPVSGWWITYFYRNPRTVTYFPFLLRCSSSLLASHFSKCLIYRSNLALSSIKVSTSNDRTAKWDCFAIPLTSSTFRLNTIRYKLLTS